MARGVIETEIGNVIGAIGEALGDGGLDDEQQASLIKCLSEGGPSLVQKQRDGQR